MIVITFSAKAVTGRILITEFLASNKTGIRDKDGDASDWIELYNSTDRVIDLAGWHLTDDEDDLAKWTFPSVSISPDEYLVVFASGKDLMDPASELHTNFKLSAGGEYLAVTEKDPSVISYEYSPSYPGQQTDRSYGIYLGQLTSFDKPTPDSANVMENQSLAPVFSNHSGYYSKSFELSINVSDPSSKIYYTTNGDIPSKSTGQLYTGPLTITKTTLVSAVSINSEGIISPVVSKTYLFIKDIVSQPATPDGYPVKWGYFLYGALSGKQGPSDYGMDPDICNNPEYKNLIDTALFSIPTISIITNPGYLFSNSPDNDTGGIYVFTGDTGYKNDNIDNSKKLGSDWERPASMEFIDPKDSSYYCRINCGLRLHGGNSRKPDNTQKHSFRLSFRSKYGSSKLNFNVFDEKGDADSFDHLVLRAGYNYSWSSSNFDQRKGCQVINDPFLKQTQIDMGDLGIHGRYVHLFLNGLYWGVYDLSEKVNNDFAESYLGGSDDDFDVVNDDGLVDGNDSEWNKAVSTAGGVSSSADDSNYASLISDNLIDLENYIDYMLINFYGGNTDWDKNNWFALRSRVKPEKGFKFVCWDAETTMFDKNINRVTLNDGIPTRMFNKLKNNREFKVLLADRIYKLLFNGGPLSAESCLKRYKKLAKEINYAIICESARWGDYYRDVIGIGSDLLYTRNDYWLPNIETVENDYIPERTEILFNQLCNAGLYPSVNPPEYNVGSGEVEKGFLLNMSVDKGDIYYTTDGSDPRVAVTSNISGSALKYEGEIEVNNDCEVKARTKNGEVWSALAELELKVKDGGNALKNPERESGIDISYNNGRIMYKMPSVGNVHIRIFSINGTCLYNKIKFNLSSGSHYFDINLPSGVYIYNFIVKNRVFRNKLIVK